MGATCIIDGCDMPAITKKMCSKHYTRWQRYGDPSFTKTAPHGDLPRWLIRHKDYTSDDCLIWPYNRDQNGYPQIKWEGRQTKAHRVMCSLVHGQQPHGHLDAAHSCGNGHLGCINPRHLSWKSRQENLSDKVRHGTLLLGSSNPTAKLSEDQVLEIKTLGASRSLSHRVIANQFGVSRETVSQILAGKNWKHVNLNNEMEKEPNHGR